MDQHPIVQVCAGGGGITYQIRVLSGLFFTKLLFFRYAYSKYIHLGD